MLWLAPSLLVSVKLLVEAQLAACLTVGAELWRQWVGVVGLCGRWRSDVRALPLMLAGQMLAEALSSTQIPPAPALYWWEGRLLSGLRSRHLHRTHYAYKRWNADSSASVAAPPEHRPYLESIAAPQ